jgi:hypothetical protein
LPDKVDRLPWWDQFGLTLRIQLSDYRDSILLLMMFSLLMPLGFMWLLGGYIGGKEPATEWFLAGNSVMTAGFGSANFAVLRVGRLRLSKEIDFYASLPIDRSAFVAGLFCLSQLSALPGLTANMLIVEAPGWGFPSRT